MADNKDLELKFLGLCCFVIQCIVSLYIVVLMLGSKVSTCVISVLFSPKIGSNEENAPDKFKAFVEFGDHEYPTPQADKPYDM